MPGKTWFQGAFLGNQPYFGYLKNSTVLEAIKYCKKCDFEMCAFRQTEEMYGSCFTNI